MMLPGALKYGGLPAFAEYCEDGELLLQNAHDSGIKASGLGERIVVFQERAEPSYVLKWLLR